MNLSPRPRGRAAVAVLASAILLPTAGGLASSSAAAAGPDLVRNGSFESGTDGWRTNTAGTTLTTAGGGTAGSRYAVLGSSTATTVVLNDLENTVTDADRGTRYTVSAMVRTDQPQAAGQLRVREVGGGVETTHASGFRLTDTSWTPVELAFTVEGDGSELDLNVLAWDNPASRHLHVDAVSLREADGEPQPQPQPQPQPDPRDPGTDVAGRLDNGCAYSQRGLPSCGAYFGGVVGGNSDPTSLESEMGATLGVRRTYYQANGQSSAVETARRDLAQGRLPWISFKLPHSWADMAAGKGDAWARDIAERLDRLAGPVWVAFHHEPENDDVSQIQQWKKLQERLGPIVRQAADNVAFTVVVMGYHQLYGAQQLRFDAMWPQTKVDVAGFDVYNFQGMPQGNGIRTEPVNLKEKYFEPFQAWSERTGTPWAIAETGYTDYTAEQKPHWIRRTFRQLRRTDGLAFSYFNSALNSKANWTLSTASKKADYGSALHRSARLPRLGS